jgi:hypothetical protein
VFDGRASALHLAGSCSAVLLNTKKPRVAINLTNVNDISFVIFVADSGAPWNPG